MANRVVGNLLVNMRAELGQLRLDVKEMERTFTSGFAGITAGAKSLAGALGASLSVGALVAFGKSVIDLAGQLEDLSAQSGISVTTLSGIKSVLEENGSSLQGFTQAITKAQAALGQAGDESSKTASSLKRIGLTLEEARKLSPEQFLERIAKGLASINEQNEKIAVARGLLGRAGAESVPALIALSGQLDDLSKKGLSPENVKKLDALGDAFTRLKNNILLGATPALVGFIDTLEHVFNLTETSQVTKQLEATRKELEALDESIARHRRTARKESQDPMLDAEVENKRFELLKTELALKEKLFKLQAPTPPKLPVAGGGLPDLAAAKKAADEFFQFQQSLQKQLAGIRTKGIGLTGGPEAELSAQLDEQLKVFKEKLSADKLKPPVGLDKFFADLKDKILAANQALSTTKLLMEQLDQAAVVADADLGEAARAAQQASRDEASRIKKLVIEQTPAAGGDLLDLSEGIDRSNLVKKFEDAKQATVDFNESLRELDRIAKALGPTFDLTGASISAIRARIEQLAKDNKLGQFADEIKKLNVTLKAADFSKSLEDFSKGLSQSITQGISQTVQGISQGTQTLAEGLKNMLRNVLANVAEFVLEKGVTEPLGKALNAALQDIFKTSSGGAAGVGGAAGGGIFDSILSSLKTSLSGLFESLSDWASSLFKGFMALFAEQGGMVPGGLQLQSFAAGGAIPIMAHRGEFVVRRPSVESIGVGALDTMNRTGQIPARKQNSAPNVRVEIFGGITPLRPNMKPEDIIKVFVDDYKHAGAVRRVIHGDRG
jgi:hypothetical protein